MVAQCTHGFPLCSWYYHFLPNPALCGLGLAFNISFAYLSLFIIVWPVGFDPSAGADDTGGLSSSGVLQIGVTPAWALEEFAALLRSDSQPEPVPVQFCECQLLCLAAPVGKYILYILLGNSRTLYILPSVPQLALDKLDIVNIWPFWHHSKTPLWMTPLISDFQWMFCFLFLANHLNFHLSCLACYLVQCELEFCTSESSRLHWKKPA